MDQVGSQQYGGHSAPVSFNEQQSCDPETINPTLGDFCGIYHGEPTATNSLGQATDLAYIHPLVSNYVQSPAVNPDLLSRYALPDQWPSVNPLLGSVNDASLLLSSAYTEQPLSASLPAYNRVHNSVSIRYPPKANEFSVPYHQFGGGNIFPVNFPEFFDPAIPPLNSNYIGCQYPVNNQNFEQNDTFWPQNQSSTVLQSGTSYDDLNYAQLGFEQTLDTDITLASSRCVRCQRERKKCIIDAFDGESRCIQCVSHGIPASSCRLKPDTIWLTPFDKFLDKKYPLRYTSIQSSGLYSPKLVQLGHYPNGPHLVVKCCQFLATDIIQTGVLRRDQFGSHLMETTSWCLENPIIDMSLYLQECIPISMNEACAPPRRLSPFFQIARDYYHIPIIKQCFEMNTIVRLLRITWQFSGEESLGMPIVRDKESPFYGLKLVPRLLRDQLNHALELKLVELETEILEGVRNILTSWTRKNCIIGYIVLFMLLHDREVYLGIAWDEFDPGMEHLSIYRSSPTDLIKRAICSCNSILSYFHRTIKHKPLYLNWDRQKSKESDSMKKLQTWVFKLRSDGLVGQRACDVYKVGNPNSVNLTISSLLFGSTGESSEVKGFLSLKNWDHAG